MNERAYWLNVLKRLAPPPLTALAQRRLRQSMPVYAVPGTFDAQGWLQIGLAGHQPGLGETYISTGSLYLCSSILLPLGLPASNRFWSDPATDWSSKKIWEGGDAPADHAI